MIILNKISKNTIISYFIVIIPLVIIVYFSYFYTEKHHKDINKLRIVDFYDLRVDISVNELVEEYGYPSKIISNYDDVYENMWGESLYSEYREIDEKTCEMIFKGRERMKSFYSYSYKPIDVIKYTYTYYDFIDNESLIAIYVKSNKVVGVSCE